MLRRILSRLAVPVGGIAFGLFLLATVEVTLRLLGLGERTRHDPFAGFSSAVPTFDLVERPDGTRVYDLSGARQETATAAQVEEPQRAFPVEKEPGTLRVFVIGGSSAAGVPYGTRIAFASWLEKRLEAELPGKRFEVVNAAMSGYATRRELVQAQEIAGYEPDLLIVYSGHNEYAERRFYEHLLDMDPRLFRFLEWLQGFRLVSLLTGLVRGNESAAPVVELDDARKGAQMFAVGTKRAGGKGRRDPRELAYEEMLYRTNLESMIRVMREAGAGTMLVTQSQNFADWPPGASAHRPDLSPTDLASWETHFAEGKRLAAEKHCERALEAYVRALAIDDSFADLHYRIASCHRALGRLAEASESYRRASDLDQIPHGAPTRYNQVAADVARSQGAMFVDAEKALREASGENLVGNDLFVDFAHPNVRGHQLIAEAIANELRSEGFAAPAGEWHPDAYQDPSPESVYAADPKLARQEHWIRAIAWMLSQRYEDALVEFDAVLATGKHSWASRLRGHVKRKLERQAELAKNPNAPPNRPVRRPKKQPAATPS